MLHEYFHERVRQDQANLSQEQTESQRLLPASEDMEIIKQHLAIIKVNGNRIHFPYNSSRNRRNITSLSRGLQ